MRCPGAGPHADLSDDRSSTWVRGQSEITRKISNSAIRWTDVTVGQQLERASVEVVVGFIRPVVRGWDWYCVCHLVLYPLFSSPAHSWQGHLWFWFYNVTVTQMCFPLSLLRERKTETLAWQLLLTILTLSAARLKWITLHRYAENCPPHLPWPVKF